MLIRSRKSHPIAPENAEHCNAASLRQCPSCHQAHMVCVEVLQPGSFSAARSPDNFLMRHVDQPRTATFHFASLSAAVAADRYPLVVLPTSNLGRVAFFGYFASQMSLPPSTFVIMSALDLSPVQVTTSTNNGAVIQHP